MARLERLLTAVLVCGCACTEGTLQPSNGQAPREVPWPTPPPLGACVDAEEPASPSGLATVEGRVEEVGLGRPNPTSLEGCPLRNGLLFGAPGFGGQTELLAQTSWLRVRDAADQELAVSALAEGFVFPLAPGDGVRARIAVEIIGFGVEASSFEARTADGGLLFWVGSGPLLADIEPPPEVAISVGDVETENEDSCVGSYRIRSMNVEIGGTTLSVRSGARVEAGPWMVVNAITREQTGMSVCPDAYADQIQVAVWSREGQVRETGGMGGPCYPDLPVVHFEGSPQYRCLPDGTLTRECGRRAPCPGVSQCMKGFCYPPQ